MNGASEIHRFGAFAALFAAFFFGAGTPVAKLMLQWIGPVTLAGLLYMGSWSGLTVYSLIKKYRGNYGTESGLKREDLKYIIGSILCGGIGAPLLLIYGLTHTSGSATSLLLNLEGILTTLIASLFFREHVGKRIWGAAFFMLLAGSALAYTRTEAGWAFNAWSVLIILSSLMWSIDNNLTRQLSHRDPLIIARIKGITSGLTNLAIAFAIGESLPKPAPLAGAVLLGVVGYGASLVFFIYSLRNLGASRTSTYFGAAPFIGAVVSILLLGEPVTLQLAGAAVLMLCGLWLILKEYHDHEHTHETLRHEHAHIHDEHHNHAHEGEVVVPHCHVHEHDLMTHSHAHVPDLHHFHRH